MGLALFKAITEGRGGMALATVIEVKGSAPRHPGTKMLAGTGAPLGTVGGGRGEALALEACRRCPVCCPSWMVWRTTRPRPNPMARSTGSSFPMSGSPMRL